MFCKILLLTFTAISPYFLWLCTENKTYTTEHHQHVAALLFLISHSGIMTVLFYDLFIQPIEWLFALNTHYGKMLWEAITSFQKATKIVNLMINITAAFYATSDLGHKQIFKEMTKIHDLSFSNLRTNVNNKIAPMAWANHSLWPETALVAVPTTLTS